MKLKRNYVKLYTEMHDTRPKYFSGKMSMKQIRNIRELIQSSGASRVLDYGSGKGYQYIARRLHEQWGGLLPHCYDPGVIQISQKPEGPFQGIICTDVMEHIDRDDVHPILGDIFDTLQPDGKRFAYFHISTRPAGKCFPDGENVHLTVEPPEWWWIQLKRYEKEGLEIRATYGED